MQQPIITPQSRDGCQYAGHFFTSTLTCNLSLLRAADVASVATSEGTDHNDEDDEEEVSCVVTSSG